MTETYHTEVVATTKGQRDDCPWPGCVNTKPVTWNFCNARDCQSERLAARMTRTIRNRQTGEWEPISPAHEAVIDRYERKRQEQWKRWSAPTPAKREANRRWKQQNPEKVREQIARYQKRLQAIRAAHRRRMDAINQRNQLMRKDAWDRAVANANDDLLALIQEQKKDEERWIVGDRWVTHLDADLYDSDDARDYYQSLVYAHGPWDDPTFDAVAARLAIAERLEAA